ATLAGAGAVLVFLREAKIRTDATLKTMSHEDQRNTLIVELEAQTHLPIPKLQGMSNMDLVLLGLGKDHAFIRGVLLAGKFRTQQGLNTMSREDQRNTLIVELSGRTNQPVAHFQAMNDATLAGAGAALVFLREGKIREDGVLKSMSDDDQRNTLIVEIAGQTHLPIPVLQSMGSIDLVGKAFDSTSPAVVTVPPSHAVSLARGVLLAGKFRTQQGLNAMSHEDQRNTLIVELSGRTNQPVAHFQAMDDATLAGAGAALVFLREGKIREDGVLKSMSDDDQRNTLIVE